MTVLAADIGATHVRFAVADVGAAEINPDALLVAGIPTLEDALSRYLETNSLDPAQVDAAVLSAAGPVREDGTIQMTNGPWTVDPGAIARAHAFPKVRVLNDLTAAALGLLRIDGKGLTQCGGSEPVDGSPKAILAPGTGLGVSGLIPHGASGWTALASEGGHVDLAPHDDREIAIVFHLLRQFGHASPERILSGRGLETLYATLGALDGAGGPPLGAVDIANAARRGDARARETIALFCGWLGSVAGDLALTLGAKGGVYIAGGFVSRWGELFDAQRFRRRFEAKGRFGEFLAPIPAYLVDRPDLALLGCLEEARRLLG